MALVITVPDPSTYLQDNSRSLAIAVVLVVSAILASIAVEVYRRHYNAKKQTQLAKHWVALWLTASSGVFTMLGYLAFLLQSNSSTLASLPFVGKHVFAVTGLAFFLYNIRLSKWYKSIAATLSKWSGTKAQTSTVVTPSLDPSGSVASDQFLGQ